MWKYRTIVYSGIYLSLLCNKTKSLFLYFSSAHAEQSSNKNQSPSERSFPFSGLYSLMTQLMRHRVPSFGNQLCVSKGLKTEMLPLPGVCQTFGSSLDEGITVCARRTADKPSHLDPSHDPNLAGSPRQLECPQQHHCLFWWCSRTSAPANWQCQVVPSPSQSTERPSGKQHHLKRLASLLSKMKYFLGKKCKTQKSLDRSINTVIAYVWPCN